jgi:hypothetical protein
MAILALAAIGGALAAFAGGDDDQPITGLALARCTAAALAKHPGGTVTETEVGDDGAAYGIEIRLGDGSEVEVHLNENCQVIGQEADDDGPNDQDDLNDEDDPNAATTLCSMRPDSAVPFNDARVFIEFNSTDEDVGLHATFDAPGWKKAVICGPDGSKLFEVRAGGNTEKYGLSQLFFEGAEPPLEEQPLEEFLARFPEGEYIIAGMTTEGDALMSAAAFTHDIPDGPVMVSPEEGQVVDLDTVVIAWEPVTSPPGVEVVRYEVFVASAQPPEGGPPPLLDIKLTLELPSTVTSVRIPPELLAPGTIYEFEVLAIDVSGNKTITSGEFVTAVPAP